MTIWYQVIRFFGAKTAEFRKYEDAVAYRDDNCSSGSVVPRVEFRPGVPMF